MDLQGAMDSIEAGRQAVKKINHAGPAREYEAAVAHLNAALMSLMIKKNNDSVDRVVAETSKIETLKMPGDARIDLPPGVYVQGGFPVGQVESDLETPAQPEAKPKRKRKKD